MDMHYRKRTKNENVDLLIDHFPLREEEILRKGIPNTIRGLEIERTMTVPGKGIIFYGRHNVQIGQFKYIQSTGKYEFKYNENAPKIIEAEDKKAARVARANKMRIQRRNKFVAITLSGLIGLGVIGAGAGMINSALAERPTTGIEHHIEREDLSQLPDAVKLAWANYATNAYSDMVADSEIEARRYSAEDLYQHYFAPIYRCYYDYCEIEASPIEKELSQGYSERLHSELEANLDSFQERLTILSLNDSLLISNTPYAKARVLDTTPNPDATVYIPLGELPSGSPYSINNLPDGAVIIDGQVYVPDSFLYETIRITK